MKKLFTIICCCITSICYGQVKWYADNSSFNNIEWNNYSTSFFDRAHLTDPIIVTAIPYNGNNANFSDINSDVDFSADNLRYRFRSNLGKNGRQLYTYDSSDVYFLTPGIFKSNAQQYEYRIMLNGTTTIKPWGEITSFADSSFGLNDFKKGMGFLGGYRTTWNNFILIELRKKNADTAFCASIVYWKPIKPVILDIFTANELNIFLSLVKNPYQAKTYSENQSRWKQRYKASDIDSSTSLPKRLLLEQSDDNLIFYLQGNIYKKEALEYRVIKDNDPDSRFKPNDFDNSFIWLKGIGPGNYKLEIRYRSQRHNITTFSFYKRPLWYQQMLFKLVVAVVLLSLVFLLIRLWQQQRKTIAEKQKKEKLNLELKALRSQLNPHFIFNALSSIQGLVNKNDLDAANHYLTEFSSLLRESLKNKDAEYISLDKELKILETYIKLEQLRFRFRYDIQLEEGLRASEIEIPALLIQPLVENAIKHGAGPAYEAGILTIRFSSANKNLIIDISDNGNGFENGSASTGFGLTLVKERIALLNQSLYHQVIQLSIESRRGGPTLVHLLFENWL